MAEFTRQNSDIIKGSSLMVFMGGEAIAFATNHSFSKTLNTNEVATKDHGDFNAIIPGNITWEATTENLYSVDGWTAVNNAFNHKTEVQLVFGAANNYSGSVTSSQTGIVGVTGASNWSPSSETGACETGKAYITSLQVTAQAGENATFTATFTGNGDLTAYTGS